MRLAPRAALGRSHFTWMILLLSTTACQSQPSSERLAQEMRTVASWAATAQLVTQAWRQHHVPTVFATQTLQQTQENLQQELKKISTVAPPQNRVAILAQVQQVKQTVTQLEHQIEQSDSTAIAESLQALSIQTQSLRRESQP